MINKSSLYLIYLIFMSIFTIGHACQNNHLLRESKQHHWNHIKHAHHTQKHFSKDFECPSTSPIRFKPGKQSTFILSLLIVSNLLPTSIAATPTQNPSISSPDNSSALILPLNSPLMPNLYQENFTAPIASALPRLQLESPALSISSKIFEIQTCFQQTMDCFNSIDYPEEHLSQECSHTAENYPELSLDDLFEIYSNLTPVNFGSEHCIYKATLNYDRLETPKGAAIALRIHVIPKRKENRKNHRHSLIAYGFLHKLRQNGISNYIAPYYGHYYAPALPNLGSYIRHEEYIKKFPSSSNFFSYTEMEYMSSTYDNERFFSTKPLTPLTARIVIEETIGEWAVQKFAHLKIEDDKARQYGLVNDDHYLVYKIGEKKYLFDPGFSPRRLDLDHYHFYSSSPGYNPNKEYNWESRQERLDGFAEAIDLISIKNYCNDLSRKGLIKSIYDNLEEWKVSAHNPIPVDKLVRYLELPIKEIGDKHS
ncbi:MAG: hypothetical protein K0M45_04260 [Candidatus Paracaedibacteraceae bacterium]|nr:hypothetical protein [Candidatus Paracaedibacteraceae bacterium]